MQNDSRRHARNGFTLLELVIIFAIIAILAAILFGVFHRVRENGRRTVCLNNLHQISLALQQYVQDNDSRFPRRDPLEEVLVPYTKDEKVFKCPSALHVEQQDQYILAHGMLAFHWKRKSDSRHEADIPDPANIISVLELVAYDQSKVEVSASCLAPAQAGVRHFNGNNYAFVDGHVKWLSAQQWGDEFCKNLAKYPAFYSEE